MKRIALGGIRGTGLYTMVDDEDFEFLSQFKWRLSRKGYVETGRSKLLKKILSKIWRADATASYERCC